MITWSVFNTEAEAIAYTESEAISHLPLGDNVTRRLFDPAPLADGRWVVQCADGDGLPWQAEWQLSPAEIEP